MDPPAGRAGAVAVAAVDPSTTTIAVPITCEPYDHSNPDLWLHTIDHLEIGATAPASVPFGGTFPLAAVHYTAAYDQPESGLTVGTMLFLTSSAQTAPSPAPFPTSTGYSVPDGTITARGPTGPSARGVPSGARRQCGSITSTPR